jgi:hypothetical protein
MRRMLLALLLVPVLLASEIAPAADDERPQPQPVGVWRAELGSLKLVLHIARGTGGYTGTLDGVDSKLHNLKVETLSLVEDVLSFQVPEVDGRFAGNVYGDSIRGTWLQGEEPRALIFFRD